ncbi:MAG: diguanylate cyclase [Thermoanaerobacteraceae bacterium]|nr:diguanylate cyclase [Thermoanaerobacteraceae bacterium]
MVGYERFGETLSRISWRYCTDLRKLIYRIYKLIDSQNCEKEEILKELKKNKIMGITLGESYIVNNLARLEGILKNDIFDIDELKDILNELKDILFINKRIYFSQEGSTTLIASNDNIMATLLLEILGENGFATGYVDDFDELLYIIDRAWPDVLLLDLNIIGFDDEKLSKISSYNWHDVPLIAIADEDYLEIIKKDIRLQILDYIIKPFNPLEITCRIGLDLERHKFFKNQCLKDQLTGAYTKPYFLERLHQEFTQFNRSRQPFSIMFLDLDGFKDINDTYGHVFGDKVLKEFSSAIISSLRGSDVFCRYGGDEFVILMPDTDGKSAERAAERIKESVSGLKTECDISFSIGIKEMDNGIASCEEILEMADDAMYIAKHSGRGRIEVYESGKGNNIVVIDSGGELAGILKRTLHDTNVILISPRDINLLKEYGSCLILINDIPIDVNGRVILEGLKREDMGRKIIYLTNDKNISSIHGPDVVFCRPFSMTELEKEIYKLT